MMKNIIGALRIDYRRSLSFLFAFGIMLFVVVSYECVRSGRQLWIKGQIIYIFEATTLFVIPIPKNRDEKSRLLK